MKFCPNCLTEYEDTASTCAECEAQPLIDEEELARRPRSSREEGDDTTAFARAATANDVFEADAFTAAVDEAGIQVLCRLRRGSSVAPLTTGVLRPWWEIMVPESDLPGAQAAIEARRNELKASEPEAAKAAEQEELAGEKAKEAEEVAAAKT